MALFHNLLKIHYYTYSSFAMILIHKKEHVALFPELMPRSYCSPSAVFLHHGHVIAHGVTYQVIENQLD